MIAIIGCGNANRCDDAVGIEVIRALRSRGRLNSQANIRLLDAGTDGMAVMFAARGCTALIVVDCCRTGATPGALFEVPGQEINQPSADAYNLHDFRWDHALFAGRRMYGEQFPSDVCVYLIEAKELGLGLGLSPQVEATAALVVEKIEARFAESVAS